VPSNKFHARHEAQIKIAGTMKLKIILNGDFQNDLLINNKLARI
jgi:hypothetical protein